MQSWCNVMMLKYYDVVMQWCFIRLHQTCLPTVQLATTVLRLSPSAASWRGMLLQGTQFFLTDFEPRFVLKPWFPEVFALWNKPFKLSEMPFNPWESQQIELILGSFRSKELCMLHQRFDDELELQSVHFTLFVFNFPALHIGNDILCRFLSERH